MAANKFDLFKTQQVTEKEGEDFAKKIDAIFSSTSAKNSTGIKPLFEKLGEKIYELNNQSITFDATMDKTKLGEERETEIKKKKCC